MVIQVRQEDLPMSDQFWLTKAQLKRIEPVFPRSVAFRDRRVVTGIVHVIRTAMAMAEGHACEGACGGLPSNPQHNFSVIFYDPWCELCQSESRGASVWCQSVQCRPIDGLTNTAEHCDAMLLLFSKPIPRMPLDGCRLFDDAQNRRRSRGEVEWKQLKVHY